MAFRPWRWLVALLLCTPFAIPEPAAETILIRGGTLADREPGHARGK